ncbi:hypothetical protein [Microbacterium sp. KR10-403]|uniref:hypothetical protein n=1 Tax=Microbacterium sp. KR10-403 TaxID=3158581 RepID=UPI0032E50049
MDDDDLEELRMLRARAYGPSADIQRDPTALQRLHELEAAVRDTAAHQAAARHTAARHTTIADASSPHGFSDTAHPGPPPPLPPDLRRAPASPAPASPAFAVRTRAQSPAPRPRLTEPTVTVADAPAAASRPRVAPRRWYLSRGFAVLWLVSLVAVAAVATGVTFAATWIAPIARHGDTRQIATLAPDPQFTWASFMADSHEDATGFTFHGISIIAMDGDDVGAGAKNATCVIAYATDTVTDDGSIEGSVWSGCGAGGFPPTLQFTVDETAPEELHDAVGAGVSLQFVYDGKRVGVFTDGLSAASPSATD